MSDRGSKRRRRRLSTRQLGSFVAASLGAIAMEPAVAQAHLGDPNSYQPMHCFTNGAVPGGPNRTPKAMENSVIAYDNCAGDQSYGWFYLYIVETYNNSALDSAGGHGSADIVKTGLNEAVQVHDEFYVTGNHHSHSFRGVSYRTP
jgi:hypothetical protein